MKSFVLKPVAQMMQSTLVPRAVGGARCPSGASARDRLGDELDVGALQRGQEVELNSMRLQPKV